jgi:hypothetical protein
MKIKKAEICNNYMYGSVFTPRVPLGLRMRIRGGVIRGSVSLGVLRVRFHGRSLSTESVLASRLTSSIGLLIGRARGGLLIGMMIGPANSWRSAPPSFGMMSVGDGRGGGGGNCSPAHKGGGGGGGGIYECSVAPAAATAAATAAAAAAKRSGDRLSKLQGRVAVDFVASGAAVGVCRQGGVGRQGGGGGVCNGGGGGVAAKAELELAVDLPAPSAPLSNLLTGWRQLNGFCS